MKKLMIGILVAGIIVVLSFSMFAAFPPTRAAPNPTIWMAPSTYAKTTNEVTVGDWFIVDVKVSNADPWTLMMFQVFLKYNKNYLAPSHKNGFIVAYPSTKQGITPPESWDSSYVFCGSSGTVGDPFLLHIDGVNDSVLLGETLLANTNLNGGDEYLLARFNFTIIALPNKYQTLSSLLCISNDQTFLYNSGGEIITGPHPNIHDGTYQLSWAPPPPPRLDVIRADGKAWPLVFPEYVDAVGQTFDVKILLNVHVAWGLTNATLTLNYNETLIAILGGTSNVTIDPFWSHSTVAIENERLTIFVKSNAAPGPSATIASVRFTIAYQGVFPDQDSTSLAFTNVTLWDHLYQIPSGIHGGGTIAIKGVRGLDLSISAPDISFSDQNPPEGSTVAIFAKIHNNGEKSVGNVTVGFWDGNSSIGERRISLISYHSEATTSIEWTTSNEGFHLMKVIVDPYCTIAETDEGNNEATRSILVGQLSNIGSIIVNGSATPNETLIGGLVTVTGYAEYNTTYGAGQPVAGAEVKATIAGWFQVATHTLRDGTYSLTISAPYAAGNYSIIITITDFTLQESIEIALTVMRQQGIDLTISQPDITFSPAEASENNNVEITATIHNIGTDNATNVLVFFYDGSTLIGNRTIPAVPNGESKATTLLWNATPWGWHTIRVAVDPENAVEEFNEFNNEATSRYYVYPSLADLTPVNLAFSDSSPLVNQSITIFADVRNIGGIDAFNVLVYFYDNGQLIGNTTISHVTARGGGAVASIVYSFSVDGYHNVCVWVDPNDAIEELNEGNNMLCSGGLYVHLPLPNLAICSSDIMFSDFSPKVGNTVTIYATVHNIGEIGASFFDTEFFDGDVKIEPTRTIAMILPGGSEVVSVSWNASSVGWHRIKVIVDGSNIVNESEENNNVASRYVYVYPELAADVCIYSEDIVFSDTCPAEGGEVTIYATVRNIGEAESGEVTATFFVDDIQLGSPKTISSILVNENATVSTRWIASQVGTHVVKVSVDTSLETNKTNNLATRAIFVGTHDVAVLDIAGSKTVVGQGYTANVTIAVQNLGNYTESFGVTIYANTTEVGRIELQLSGGELVVSRPVWNTTGFAWGHYVLKAISDVVPGETRTSDNVLIGSYVYIGIPGDVDGNGFVNMLDLYYIAGHFGANRGDPSYVANYDIDDNGTINMLDLYIAAIHFGQTDS